MQWQDAFKKDARLTSALADAVKHLDAANKLALRDSKAVHFKPLINAALRQYLDGKVPKFEETLRRIIREELKSSAA